MENAADLAVLGFVLLSGLWAFFRGFVREVLGVIAWVGAALITIWGFPYARPYLRELISIQLVADVVTGLSLFIISLVLLALISGAISNRVRGSGLSALDRSLGFLFGLVRGAALVCIAYLVMEWAVPPAEQPRWVTTARTLPFIEKGAAVLAKLVPGDIRAQGAAAVGRASREAEEKLNAAKVLRDLNSPEPKSDASRDAGSYTPQERRALEQRIQAEQ